MGVKELWKLVEPCEKQISPEELRGKVIAVDASIWIQQAIRGVRAGHINGTEGAHSLIFFKRVIRLMEHGAKLIFVFDGKAPAVKQRVLEARRRQRMMSYAFARQAASKMRALNDQLSWNQTEISDDESTSSNASSDTESIEIPSEIDNDEITKLPYKTQRKIIQTLYSNVKNDKAKRASKILHQQNITPRSFSNQQLQGFLEHTKLRVQASSLREAVGTSFKRKLIEGNDSLVIPEEVDIARIKRIRNEEDRFFYMGPRAAPKTHQNTLREEEVKPDASILKEIEAENKADIERANHITVEQKPTVVQSLASLHLQSKFKSKRVGTKGDSKKSQQAINVSDSSLRSGKLPSKPKTVSFASHSSADEELQAAIRMSLEGDQPQQESDELSKALSLSVEQSQDDAALKEAIRQSLTNNVEDNLGDSLPSKCSIESSKLLNEVDKPSAGGGFFVGDQPIQQSLSTEEGFSMSESLEKTNILSTEGEGGGDLFVSNQPIEELFPNGSSKPSNDSSGCGFFATCESTPNAAAVTTEGGFLLPPSVPSPKSVIPEAGSFLSESHMSDGQQEEGGFLFPSETSTKIANPDSTLKSDRNTTHAEESLLHAVKTPQKDNSTLQSPQRLSDGLTDDVMTTSKQVVDQNFLNDDDEDWSSVEGFNSDSESKNNDTVETHQENDSPSDKFTNDSNKEQLSTPTSQDQMSMSCVTNTTSLVSDLYKYDEDNDKGKNDSIQRETESNISQSKSPSKISNSDKVNSESTLGKQISNNNPTGREANQLSESPLNIGNSEKVNSAELNKIQEQESDSSAANQQSESPSKISSVSSIRAEQTTRVEEPTKSTEQQLNPSSNNPLSMKESKVDISDSDSIDNFEAELNEINKPQPPPPQTLQPPQPQPKSDQSEKQRRYLTLTEAMTLQQQRLDALRKVGANASDDVVAEIKHLLDLFGIPYITSPGEADSQCGALCELGHADAVATEDSDVLLFGAKQVIRGLASRSKGWGEPTMVSLDKIKSTLGFSKRHLVSLAMLVGSDYTEGLRHVGMNTAQQLLLALSPLKEDSTLCDKVFVDTFLKSIQTFMKEDNRSQDPTSTTTSTDLVDQVQSHAKSCFVKRKRKLESSDPHFPNKNVIDAYLSPVVDGDTEQFTWGVPLWKELTEYGVTNAGIPRLEVEKMITTTQFRTQFNTIAPTRTRPLNKLGINKNVSEMSLVTRSLFSYPRHLEEIVLLEMYLKRKPALTSSTTTESREPSLKDILDSLSSKRPIPDTSQQESSTLKKRKTNSSK